MNEVIKALGFFLAMFIIVVSLLNGVPILTSFFRALVVVIATYVGGFVLYMIGLVILQPQNRINAEMIEDAEHVEAE